MYNNPNFTFMVEVVMMPKSRINNTGIINMAIAFGTINANRSCAAP